MDGGQDDGGWRGLGVGVRGEVVPALRDGADEGELPMEVVPRDLRGLCAAGRADAPAASGAPALARASALLAELQAPAQVRVGAVDGLSASDVRCVLAGEACGDVQEG